MRKQRYQPYALTTVFCWALAFVFARMALSYFSAALIVIAIVTKMKPPSWRTGRCFGLAGFSCI